MAPDCGSMPHDSERSTSITELGFHWRRGPDTTDQSMLCRASLSGGARQAACGLFTQEGQFGQFLFSLYNRHVGT